MIYACHGRNSFWIAWCTSSCQSLLAPLLHIQAPPPPPFPCIVRQSVAAIPSPPEAAVFPGSLISMAVQLRISVPCLPIHRGRWAWLAVTGSIPHPHPPLNKATQQDCFSLQLVAHWSARIAKSESKVMSTLFYFNEMGPVLPQPLPQGIHPFFLDVLA